jgi:hypothetical protein
VAAATAARLVLPSILNENIAGRSLFLHAVTTVMQSQRSILVAGRFLAPRLLLLLTLQIRRAAAVEGLEGAVSARTTDLMLVLVVVVGSGAAG